MLYCSNPNCSSPFNYDKVKTCQTCGSQQLASLFRHRYQIIRQLGNGGFGRTYEARDVDKMNHICAIKQLVPPYQEPVFLEKVKNLFQQEATQLHELGKHPQIPELYAFFEQDKRLYLVQEFIPGQTLLSERDREGNFSEEKIIHLLRNLLPVLKFIHDRKIVHRDIKPENIMRHSSSERSDLVLIDFGISKQLTDSNTHPGTIIGTPGYAPVEQLSGYVSPASDLYSLGVTCLRLLTGYFPKQNGSDALYNPAIGKWQWREKLTKKIGDRLGQILDRLIQKEIRDRYQSVEEVLKDLSSLKMIAKTELSLPEIPKTKLFLPPESKVIMNEEHRSRLIQETNESQFISGIVLTNPDIKELDRIAKQSVSLIEMRLNNQSFAKGSSFMYKQVIFPKEKRSRCYFMTNLHVISNIVQWEEILYKAASSDYDIDDVNLDFVTVWNQQLYPIERFLIPQGVILKIEDNDPTVQYLDFALFEIDIETTARFDFFGIANKSSLKIGDRIYAFGDPQSINPFIADGIVGNIYEDYTEEINNPIIKGAIQHNIAIAPDNTGGPTVNEFGEIVGISRRRLTTSVAVYINFSLNIQGILERIKEVKNLEILDVKQCLTKLKTAIADL
jgi:serine/threonine protein kinase